MKFTEKPRFAPSLRLGPRRVDLSGYLTGQVFGFFLVFARIGSATIFLPGFGESYVTPRTRLMLALVISLALYPATPVPPIAPDNPIVMARLFATEITAGLWIGLVARILMTALQFAGYQIGQVSGLANAFASNTESFQGSTMVANFLLVSGVALIFITNTHYIIIRALLASYDVFPFGQLMTGDLAQQMAKAVSASFYIGLSLAAPFLVLGLLVNLGLGLANRMMPSLPVFFVAAPLLIAGGMLIFSVAAPSMLRGFLQQFALWLETFTL